MRHLALCFCMTFFFVLGGTHTSVAQTKTPLLIPGKTTLFERVLTRPGAKLAATAGAPGTEAIPAFTPLFVYARTPGANGQPGFLQVGTDAKGKITGFIAEDATIPWQHALVLAFTERANRDRVLFFKDQQPLLDWLNDKDVAAKAAEARQEIDSGKLPPASPIVSIEPEVPVDFEKNFYMLPILEAQNRRLATGFQVRTVKVASVTKNADAAPVEQLRRRVNPSALENFRAGVVFVIDASSSMQPYIDRTREAMDGVLKQVEQAGLADKVRFGLVAYRDDPTKVKGMEYLTKTFADPNSIRSDKDFETATQDVKASKDSTRAYAEDGYAGIDKALSGVDWKGFGARFIVMITDASSREGNSPLSSTKMNTDQIRQLAQSQGTAIYTLHLKTASGAKDHATAEAQYKSLTQYPGVGSLYYPVEAGNPDAFKSTVQQLAEALVKQVADAQKAIAQPGDEPAPAAKTSKGAPTIDQSASQVGRAMALAYLGREAGAEAPSMFEAWASDRDFAHPDIAPFSVRVLLTKNQLSDLQRTLQTTVDALEAAQVDPGDLFNQLRSAAAAVGRDPSKIGQGQAKNLEATGLMGEYLDGLPFESQIMTLSQDDWTAMSVGEQQAIIDGINSKIRLYQRYHDDTTHWVALNPGDDPGDTVFPVPLESLP
ncbi:von Willebrand factor type A domain-containing protein [Arboricoccus pini]|uniref:von Willebrand factor type A domain-containing protein n=1 Tax=Arboricoccus pini TaxID=1963835 RepID=A0A212Q8Q9_9PROT|nr:vWA domain-containing protein [Arboricoccus pini]SNB55778.1 von Willebrand factor type A domain-containing protein [Arboricoccus pini]